MMNREKRECRVLVTISAVEKEYIRQAAEEEGHTVASYLRFATVARAKEVLKRLEKEPAA